mgnify:CR=1 FL=1
MKNNIDIDAAMLFLSSVDLFIDLDSKIIRNMAESMVTASYKTGDFLIHRGRPGKHMLLINQGQVSVELRSGMVNLGKADVDGESSLISVRTSQADVIAQLASEAVELY